ncbi:hypothetical protein [Streptomyces sp. NPDC017529]|uniref:hypothetical protein n=1 Tax=Streptomyces sp. NPDC017529 TaxID=3365000 RepID=UPI0037AD5A8B
MYYGELEHRVRHEELRRQADRERLVLQVRKARRAARRAAASGTDDSGGRVSGLRERFSRAA